MIYANLQGAKDNICPFYHSIGSDRVKGKLISMPCEVIFYFSLPEFDKNGPSTTKISILSYGKHNHPAPPAQKISEDVKDIYRELFHTFGIPMVTARQLLASPLLPILLNGSITLTADHISLMNVDVINHLIHKERLKNHPVGTSLLGVQHLMTQRSHLSDPYIRVAVQNSDGKYIVVSISVTI